MASWIATCVTAQGLAGTLPWASCMGVRRKLGAGWTLTRRRRGVHGAVAHVAQRAHGDAHGLFLVFEGGMLEHAVHGDVDEHKVVVVES